MRTWHQTPLPESCKPADFQARCGDGGQGDDQNTDPRAPRCFPSAGRAIARAARRPFLCLRVSSYENSFLLRRVRMNALVASKAKRNIASRGVMQIGSAHV